MSKLFQIYEDDLCELEKIIPSIADALAINLNPQLRTKFRVVQKILSNVRWNYGPLENVKVVEEE